MSDTSYGRSEAFLRSSCLDNAFQIPEEFNQWQPYFWSRGAMLREWSRWLGAKLAGRIAKVETDMQPHRALERKIKERRESSGHPGPGFQSQTVASTQSGRSHWDCSQYAKPKLAHQEPAIERPSGSEGEHHHII